MIKIKPGQTIRIVAGETVITRGTFDPSNGKTTLVTINPPITVTKRGRGRPRTGKGMTNAERQAKFKALRKVACQQP